MFNEWEQSYVILDGIGMGGGVLLGQCLWEYEY